MGGPFDPPEIATAIRDTLENFLEDHSYLAERTVVVLDAEDQPGTVRLMVDEQMFRLAVEEAK